MCLTTLIEKLVPNCSDRLPCIATDREAVSRLNAVLSTYVILAGLLVSACYPAIYGTREVGDDPWRLGAVATFRTLAVLATALSLAVIVLAIGTMVLYQNNYSVESKRLSDTATVSYIIGQYYLIPWLMMLAVGLTFASMIVAAVGFLPHGRGWRCVVVLAVVAFVTLLWLGSFNFLVTKRVSYASEEVNSIIACCLATLPAMQAIRGMRDVEAGTSAEDSSSFDMFSLYLRCLECYRMLDPTSVLPTPLSSYKDFKEHFKKPISAAGGGFGLELTTAEWGRGIVQATKLKGKESGWCDAILTTYVSGAWDAPVKHHGNTKDQGVKKGHRKASNK